MDKPIPKMKKRPDGAGCADQLPQPTDGPQNPTPLQAIQRRCLDCCCGVASEVTNCTTLSCPLWPYRFGTDPFRARPRAGSQSSRGAVDKSPAGMMGAPDLPNREKQCSKGQISGQFQTQDAESQGRMGEPLQDTNGQFLAKISPEISTPLKAIRAHCLWCMCGDRAAVAECCSSMCPVHAFRSGKNPNHARTLSPDDALERVGRFGPGRKNDGGER